MINAAFSLIGIVMPWIGQNLQRVMTATSKLHDFLPLAVGILSLN